MFLFAWIPILNAATNGPATARSVDTLLTEIATNNYDALVSNAAPALKSRITRETFTQVSSQLSPRLKKGYKLKYLGSLKQQDVKVLLWKINYQDGGDDMLARLGGRGGKTEKKAFLFQAGQGRKDLLKSPRSAAVIRFLLPALDTDRWQDISQFRGGPGHPLIDQGAIGENLEKHVLVGREDVQKVLVDEWLSAGNGDEINPHSSGFLAQGHSRNSTSLPDKYLVHTTSCGSNFLDTQLPLSYTQPTSKQVLFRFPMNFIFRGTSKGATSL